MTFFGFFRRSLILFPVLCFFSVPFFSWGDESIVLREMTAVFSGSFTQINPASSGGEWGGALMFPMDSLQTVSVGPRVGLLWTGGSLQNRFDFQWGLEGCVWFFNALGIGGGVDWVVPSFVSVPGGHGWESRGGHFRFEPSLSIRILHHSKQGAWALRFGAPYDSLYQWGVKLGLSLQLTGVPQWGINEKVPGDD